MDFRILGPLEVWEADRRLPLGGAKHRALLAILLLEANRVVSTDRLVELLWGDEPPETVNNTLQVCVSQLRKILEPGHVRGSPYQLLVSQEPGYLIRANADQIDLRRFERLREDAQHATSNGHPDAAAHALREAIALWRGPPLADIAAEPYAIAEGNRLNEMRLGALEDRIEADLALGRHRELVGELEALVGQHPLRERFRAQLMLALYRSGRQAEASDVFHKTRAVLVEELAVEPGQELQKLLKAILNQDPALNLVQGQQSAPARKTNNLPLSLTSFVGRIAEVEEVKDLMLRSRLLTLTGTAGIGKTRLAAQVAGQVVKHFRDGVWLVELGPLTDPVLVPQTVATAVGLREEASTPVSELIINYLETRQVLLLFDNCEHLLQATANLAQAILRSCAGVRVLTTSRESLGVDGEKVWRVPSLSLPDSERLSDVRWTDYEALTLFAQRATDVLGTFVLTETTGQLVVQICQRLDGIPLAIELAAGRLKVLSLEQVADRLSDRFRLLTGGSRTAMPRQQTLRAAIDWSYELLHPTEQVLLRRLAVFVGGFSLEAAEAIVPGNGNPIRADQILEYLAELVEKSLILVSSEGGGRYRLLETIRQYGLEKLVEASEAGELRARHRDWYLAQAERAEVELRGPNQLDWVERLEWNCDNLRAALAWCLDTGDQVSALRMAGSLGIYWRHHGRGGEGRVWLERALGPSDAPPGVRGKALLWSAALSGDWARAEVITGEALLNLQDAGDPSDLALAQNLLGTIVMQREGTDDLAPALFQSSLTLFRDVGNAWGVGLALYSLGFYSWMHGSYKDARERLEDGLSRFRQVGDNRRTAVTLQVLGRVELSMANYVAASALLSESITWLKKVRDTEDLAWSVLNLGIVARCEGHYERARTLIQESIAYWEPRQLQGMADAFRELGIVYELEGDIARADALLKESLRLMHELKDRSGMAKAIQELAGICARQSQFGPAAVLLRAASAERSRIRNPVEPFERHRDADLVTRIRNGLGALGLSQAWDGGAVLSLDEAMALVLAGDRVPAEATLFS